MTGITLHDLTFLTPEILMLVFAIVILLLPKKSGNLAYVLSIIGSAVAVVLCVLLWGSDVVIANTYEVNAFALVFKVVFLILALITLIGSRDFTQSLRYAKEYYALIMVATTGLMALGSVGDFISLFVAFELVSIATYALPLIDPNEENGKEAALKYFIMGAFSSGLILYGFSLLYGFTGTMSITGVVEALSTNGIEPIVLVAMVLCLAGFGYKMALVPFHLWAPDTYQGAPAPVSGFLAGITKKGAFVVAFKIFLVTLVAIKMDVSILLGIIAALTMTVGNIVALMQKNVKRMMAYSSVAHAGNILVGLAIFTQMSNAGAMLHIIAHGLMTVGAFYAIYIVSKRFGGDDLEHFSGLSRTAPWTAFAFMLILLSLAGVPPFLGFWSKMVIVVSAFEVGGWFIALALILVLNSALSLVFYARVIKVMYMGAPPEHVPPKKRFTDGGSYLIGLYLSLIILTVTGLFPNQVMALCMEAIRFIIP